jgi:transposase
MPAPLSNDLRKRIIEARENGDTVPKIMREKNVSKSTVDRLMRSYRGTGSYEPLPLNNGRKSNLTDEQLEQVRQMITQRPDITINELIQALSLPITGQTHEGGTVGHDVTGKGSGTEEDFDHKRGI